MSKRRNLYNAKVVTPDQVIDNGFVVIEGERIAEIGEGRPAYARADDVNAEGNWLFPGIVDSHSDAIEIELEPRPSSQFPIEVSFYELERKLVGQGITTIYHSLSLTEGNALKWTRQNETVLDIIQAIRRLAQGRHLIRHKTHLRYEITNVEAVTDVQKLIVTGGIDQLSFMDHSPGQGQFRDLEVHKKYLIEHRHYSEEQVTKLLEESEHQRKLDPAVLHALAESAYKHGIPVASHDDDTFEKLSLVKSWQATISEFPVELDVALKAKEMGLFVVMGAPNALLGKSHSNNVSAMEALEHGAVDIFCSDYYPSSLLHTVFKLYHRSLPMYEAVNLVSLNPAKALNIASEVGSIEVGKQADLLIVGEDAERPVLHTVFVGGRNVCQMNYHTPR